MKHLINVLSSIGSFMLVYGLSYFILDKIFGRIEFLDGHLLHSSLSLKNLIFNIIILYFIIRYVNFYQPKSSKL